MKTSAQICRDRGWAVDDILEGTNEHFTERMRITAIGEQFVLGKTMSRDGQPIEGLEGSWDFNLRNWRKTGHYERPPIEQALRRLGELYRAGSVRTREIADKIITAAKKELDR